MTTLQPATAPVQASPTSPTGKSVNDGKTPFLKVVISSLLFSLLIVIVIILIRLKVWKERDKMRAVAESMIEKMKKRKSSTRISKSKEHSAKKGDDIDDDEKWVHSLYDALW
jgi:mannitol-specific phosphotransferase system IIBC component